MKRQLFFLILLSSWICGVSLICLFPPVSDFSKADIESGCINKESVPELNLKNSSRNRSVLQLDGFSDIQILISDFGEGSFLRLEILPIAGQAAGLSESFFDVKMIFRQFFENF